MKTFRVVACGIHVSTYIVKAESQAEAEAKVLQEEYDDCIDFDLEGPDDVIEVEQLED